MIALLLLAVGCSDCPPEGFTCPDEPVRDGEFAVAGSDWPEVTSGSVAITDGETVTIEYFDARGRTIRVRYERTL